MKPSASGQKTSHNMSKAVLSANRTAGITRKAYPEINELSLERARPAFLDVLAPVDEEGARPGNAESRHDDCADNAEIEFIERSPESALERLHPRYRPWHPNETAQESE